MTQPNLWSFLCECGTQLDLQAYENTCRVLCPSLTQYKNAAMEAWHGFTCVCISQFKIMQTVMKYILKQMYFRKYVLRT